MARQLVDIQLRLAQRLAPVGRVHLVTAAVAKPVLAAASRPDVERRGGLTA